MKQVVHFETKTSLGQSFVTIGTYVDDTDYSRIQVLSITHVEHMGNYTKIQGTGIVID